MHKNIYFFTYYNNNEYETAIRKWTIHRRKYNDKTDLHIDLERGLQSRTQNTGVQNLFYRCN